MPTPRTLLTAAALVTALAGTAGATTASTNIMNDLRAQAATDGARDLLVRADEVLNALEYTTYRESGEEWSDADGYYEVSCSGYADHLLDDALPEAYDELRDARDTTRPRSEDFYFFFKSIPAGGTLGRWARPARVSDLRPGDMLVWKYMTTGGSTSGHTTIVVGLPVLYPTRGENVWRVRVTDSARSGHSNDNRGSSGSGVGAGELLVKTGSTGQPIAFAWSLGGSWRTDISLALGRPRS